MDPDLPEVGREHTMTTRQGVQMQDVAPLVALRVLYTLNASPQYLLARQRRKVQVIPILEDQGNKHGPFISDQIESMTSKYRYAKVALKTCLEAVCNASPELVCDRSRDYSVYVVDPLEFSPSEDHVPHTGEQPSTEASSGSASSCPWGECVSIGMGLMSWCLAENRLPLSQTEDDQDEGYIVGKFVRDRGADALEIIMSLRETATQTQHQHALSLSSWGLAAPSKTPMNSGASSPSAQLSSYFPSSPSPLPVTFSSQGSTVNDNPDSDGMPEIKDNHASHSSALGYMSRSNGSSDPPSRVRTKKIGRPQGAKTHPEKRARQLAIQMHKEKLERLLNIVKMQNGEEYDKTLIIASECASKVTEEVIARERKLLEELQARPLIVDGPRYTTQPLPKRKSSPATRVPLVETTAAKHVVQATLPGNAIASGSGNSRNEKLGDALVVATTEQREAGLLLTLLSSVLGNVDESSGSDATARSCGGNGKGKEKQANPPINDALANALQNLLPYLPNHTGQPNSPPSEPLTVARVDTARNLRFPPNDPKSRPELEPKTIAAKRLYPRLFETAEEAFYSGANWHSDTHWATRNAVPAKQGVPKVREDAHPVPGGGWARGRNIVPRVMAPSSQPETASSESAADIQAIDTLTRPGASSITTTDKENMPPAKAKRGLKRSFSSSVDAKENATTIDSLSPKQGAKKRKEESMAKSVKPRATKRAMMGSVETNKTTPGTQMMYPASSPVRSRGPTSSPRNLPVVAMSEPEPALVGPCTAATTVTQDLFNDSTKTSPGSGRPSSELEGPLIASPASPKFIIKPPMTPPRTRKPLHDDAGESLFTPCATSVSRLEGENLVSSPSPASHVVDLHERPSTSGGEHQDATVACRHVGTGWDLPPSSPPPPTSPALPDNDLAAEEDQMDWDFAVQLQSELDIEMEKSSMDGRFEDHGTTTSCADASTSMAGVHTLGDDEPSDQRSIFEATAPVFDASSDIFDSGELGQVDGKQQHEGGDGLELDIDELWSSLGPVIAHAHVDADSHSDADFGFSDLTQDQDCLRLEEQSTVDPVKLAEDLKALFGGCVV